MMITFEQFWFALRGFALGLVTGIGTAVVLWMWQDIKNSDY